MALLTLAEQALKDTADIHFNSSTGFGVPTDVNGETVNAELSEVESELAGGGRSAAILKEMELRVLAGQVKEPKPNSSMEVNGISWNVSAAGVVDGELIVMLYRHKS